MCPRYFRAEIQNITNLNDTYTFFFFLHCRWWSDCTNNWREKWSKVRNEKNKVKEESKQLRNKLDSSIKENTTLKQEREELRLKLETFILKENLEDCHVSQPISDSAVSAGGDTNPLSKQDKTVIENPQENFVSDLLSHKGSSELSDSSGQSSAKQTRDKDVSQDELLTQKVTALKYKLEEAKGLLIAERQ